MSANLTSIAATLIANSLGFPVVISEELTKEMWEKIKPIFLNPEKIDFDKKLLETTSKRKTNYLKELKSAHQKEDLVLVLGAGASAGYNLPSWNSLLQKLMLKTLEKNPDQATVLSKFFTEVFNLNPLIIGRYLQNYYKHKEISFEEEVRSILYEDVEGMADESLMNEIVNLCAAPGKMPNLNSIITYNYDDILENKIKKLNIKIPIKEIYGIGMQSKNEELSIYHVHGYLPRNEKLNDNNSITLGEAIYHQQYLEIYSWNNIVQINKFRDNTCLFIGVSLNDPNTRRLLDIAKKHGGLDIPRHFIFKKKYNLETVKQILTEKIEKGGELLNEKIDAGLKFDEVAKIMIDLIESFEENDSLSLGVNTIWINEYSEIPSILSKLRET